MKKQKRQLLILAVILLVLAATAIGVTYYRQQQEEKEAENTEESIRVYQTESEEISEWKCEIAGQETLHLVKTDDTWSQADDTSETLDQDTVAATLSQLSDITAKRVLTDADLSEYGFDEPLGRITLTVDQQEITFVIGMKNELTEEYYMTKDDDAGQVYVVDETLYEILQKTAADYAAAETAEE